MGKMNISIIIAFIWTLLSKFICICFYTKLMGDFNISYIPLNAHFKLVFIFCEEILYGIKNDKHCYNLVWFLHSFQIDINQA